MLSVPSILLLVLVYGRFSTASWLHLPCKTVHEQVRCSSANIIIIVDNKYKTGTLLARNHLFSDFFEQKNKRQNSRKKDTHRHFRLTSIFSRTISRVYLPLPRFKSRARRVLGSALSEQPSASALPYRAALCGAMW